MSPERSHSPDDSDGGGGLAGGGAIIGGHVTVETSSPIASPEPMTVIGGTAGASTATAAAHLSRGNHGTSMVQSSVAMEQQHLQQQQQQHHQHGSSAANMANGTNCINNINNNNNTNYKNHNTAVTIATSTTVGSINSTGNGSSHGTGNGSNIYISNGNHNHGFTINLSGTGGGIGNNGSTPAANSSNGGSHYQGVTTATAVNGSSNSNGTSNSNSNTSSSVTSNPNMASGNTTGTTMTTVVTSGGSAGVPLAAVPPPVPKIVVVHQGRVSENYITATTDGMNGVGNIVLLAAEPMDMSEHDITNNNIVIGGSPPGGRTTSTIIVSAATGHSAATAAGMVQSSVANGASGTGTGGPDEELTPLTWLQDANLIKAINLSSVPASTQDSPRQTVGHLSPTSDFVEDSSVSEDNTSSANSSPDQGIGVYCTEVTANGGRPVQQHHTYQSGTSQKTITVNGDTFIEYPGTSHSPESKELKSPVSSSGSSPPSSSSSVYGSSTPTSNPGSTTPVSSSIASTTTPYQHFHKKYLREEHVKQQQALKQANAFVTPVKQSQQHQQQNSRHDDGDVVEDRHYPAAPIKNGYSMGSPNVSGDDYSGYSNQKPPSPSTSPPISHHPAQAGHTQQQSHGQQQLPASPQSSSKLSPPKSKHPTNVPYDPLVHISSKPPYSFSSLIFMAIENSQSKALPVKEIYAWIVQHFPFFKTAPTGWKNSVRHNLSLNKCFQKVEKAANLGKGSLWMVEPQFRPNLIQALSRAPFHSSSGIDKTAYKQMHRLPDSPSGNGANYSKDHFPQLASRLAPNDAHNGSHHEDMDDISRSSTPIDYDAGEFAQPQSSSSSSSGHHHPHHHQQYPLNSQQQLQQQQQQQPQLQQHQLHQQQLPSQSHSSNHHLSQNSHNHYGGTTNGGHHNMHQQLAHAQLQHHHVAVGSYHHCDSPEPGSGQLLLNGTGTFATQLVGRDWSADTVEEVNAATAMLQLKHGTKIFSEGFHNGHPPIITSSPSEDHTYSAGGSIPSTSGAVGCPSDSQNNSDNNSNGTSSDAAYESSEESQHLQPIDDSEEQRRQAGVDALLNLAGVANYYSSPATSIQASPSLKRPVASAAGTITFSDPVAYEHHHHHPTTVTYASSSLETIGRLSTNAVGGGGGGGGYPLLPGGARAQLTSNGTVPNTITTTTATAYYMPDDLSQYSSPTPPKKSKSRTSLKKLKKKASWVR